MSAHLSRHYTCDDPRHYTFARRCPDFYPPRRNPDRKVWIAVVVALFLLAARIAAEHFGVIAP